MMTCSYSARIDCDECLPLFSVSVKNALNGLKLDENLRQEKPKNTSVFLEDQISIMTVKATYSVGGFRISVLRNI